MRHELKVVPPYFDALLDGRKTFELRRDDRGPYGREGGFAVGDTLWLREWLPGYSGRSVLRRVTFILNNDDGFPGLGSGFVIMAIAPEPEDANDRQ